MRFSKQILIQDLIQKTEEIISIVENEFKVLSKDELFNSAEIGKWTVAQCLEHLNLYGDYYHEHIQSRMDAYSGSKGGEKFKSSWLGNYFANSMLPGAKMKTMKTFKDKDTTIMEVPENVVERFLTQQKHLLKLLNESKETSLSKIRIPITIAPLIRLKLGDTFRFSVNHNWRHIVQAQKVIGR